MFICKKMMMIIANAHLHTDKLAVLHQRICHWSVHCENLRKYLFTISQPFSTLLTVFNVLQTSLPSVFVCVNFLCGEHTRYLPNVTIHLLHDHVKGPAGQSFTFIQTKVPNKVEKHNVLPL